MRRSKRQKVRRSKRQKVRRHRVFSHLLRKLAKEQGVSREQARQQLLAAFDTTERLGGAPHPPRPAPWPIGGIIDATALNEIDQDLNFGGS